MNNSILDKNEMIDYILREYSQIISGENNILIEGFLKSYITFFPILGGISSNIDTLSAIDNAFYNSTVGGNLKCFLDDCQLISRVRPFDSKENSQAVNYKIINIFSECSFSTFIATVLSYKYATRRCYATFYLAL